MEKYRVDGLGPEMVVEVRDPKIGLHGILVIDNTTRGPGKGGIRMTPTVTVGEVAQLARVMTWKTALAQLPFGGAKAGIVADPKKLTNTQKKKLIQAFARLLKPLCPSRYIAGPDMGTGEREMRWFAESNGDWHAATGKPASYCMRVIGKKAASLKRGEPRLGWRGEKCGIPHEFGSTGWGVAQATAVATKHRGISLKGATVAIEGFGNVGSFAFRYLEKMGATIVAISDSQGTIYNPKGISFSIVTQVKKKTGTVVNYSPGKKLTNEDLFTLPVDILIPSAVPDVIDEKNAKEVKAKLIVEGSNIPIKEEVEQMLHQRNILIIPDFVANTGGVISSYSEYIGQNPSDMMKTVAGKIKKNVAFVLRRAAKKKITPREAAIEIATSRIKKTK